jgi:hypothetical protein
MIYKFTRRIIINFLKQFFIFWETNNLKEIEITKVVK